MKHPRNRSQRRHNGEVWRNRQRFIMTKIWHQSKIFPYDWTENRMWWGRKQTVAHGNRCCCHYEKTSHKEIRKRRRALDEAISESIYSFQELAPRS